MYCNDKLKLNKFVRVAIPKNSDYFQRFSGSLPRPIDGQFSGDESLPSAATKLEQLDAAARANDYLLNNSEDSDNQE